MEGQSWTIVGGVVGGIVVEVVGVVAVAVVGWCFVAELTTHLFDLALANDNL